MGMATPGRRGAGGTGAITFAAYLTSRGYTVRDAGHARTHGPAAQRRRGTTLAGTPTRVRTCVGAYEVPNKARVDH